MRRKLRRAPSQGAEASDQGLGRAKKRVRSIIELRKSKGIVENEEEEGVEEKGEGVDPLIAAEDMEIQRLEKLLGINKSKY
jgi:hypothetical protein